MGSSKKQKVQRNTTELQEIPAGCFSSWLRRTRYGLIHEKGSVVNCGTCKACCTSSYFIHIRPGETEALSRINKKLLFPAPGLPKGNVLLGYFENGYCPMMTDKGCKIYAHRPLTCRTYDCRIFTAAGIDAGYAEQALINQRVQQWRFSYPTQCDQDQHGAVQAAVMFMKKHENAFPAGIIPKNPSQLALLGIKVYRVFLIPGNEQTEPQLTPGDIVERVIAELEKFDNRKREIQQKSEGNRRDSV